MSIACASARLSSRLESSFCASDRKFFNIVFLVIYLFTTNRLVRKRFCGLAYRITLCVSARCASGFAFCHIASNSPSSMYLATLTNFTLICIGSPSDALYRAPDAFNEHSCLPVPRLAERTEAAVCQPPLVFGAWWLQAAQRSHTLRLRPFGSPRNGQSAETCELQ